MEGQFGINQECVGINTVSPLEVKKLHARKNQASFLTLSLVLDAVSWLSRARSCEGGDSSSCELIWLYPCRGRNPGLVGGIL